jgi:hypothetical protein
MEMESKTAVNVLSQSLAKETRISNAQSYFQFLSKNGLEFLPIQIENVEKVCNNIQKPTDLCDFRINAQCAEHFVIDNKKSWSLWSGAALACGCPLNAE